LRSSGLRYSKPLRKSRGGKRRVPRPSKCLLKLPEKKNVAVKRKRRLQRREKLGEKKLSHLSYAGVVLGRKDTKPRGRSSKNMLIVPTN